LAEIGSHDAAREAGMEMARVESYGPLAALIWRRLSELAASVPEKLSDLDHAVARAPALPSVRRARFSARLARRDIEGALGDAEHLEALARGSRARHAACRAAARELLDAGFTRDAGKLFERALRYVPSDPAATAGLGRAFVEIGRIDRAVALLERAVSLGEREGRADPDALVDLAKLLAGPLKDLPQAVARVRQVPASASAAVSARGFEARWRAALGDVVGASLAYARTRETLELRGERSPAALAWLVEAARFERDVTSDVLAAERHLAVALRLAPQDPEMAALYREAAALVAARLQKHRQAGESGT
jgi:tetratricopeptide (TPR) repeat protein